MCGIFGVLVGPETTIPRAVLQSTLDRLFTLSESRGKEASGLALRNGEGIQVLKQPVPATKLIRSGVYRDRIKSRLIMDSGELFQEPL